MTADYRDLVIEDAALEYVAACERIQSLEADNAVLRELVVASLDALAAKTDAYNRLRDQHHHNVEELRAMREWLLLRAGVEDLESATV